MAHLYGHTWPIRWGAEGERKMVKVYSNCETAELFVNGKSAGVKHRNSQDFPAAGLRWMTPFAAGKNTLRVIATKGNKTVTDEITFLYQTETWDSPSEMKLTEKSRSTADGKEIVAVEAKLYDAKGVQCLDARNRPALQHSRHRHAHRQPRHNQSIACRRRCPTAGPRSA